MMKLIFLLLFMTPLFSRAQQTKIYGFVLANDIVSTNGIESFGRPNAVAYTAAGNPAVNAYSNKASQSFQVQQSRLGIKTDFSDDVGGVFEFDFVDFSKSTPAVAALIRVRRAYVAFKHENWTFIIGQDWDLFSPLAPHTYNLVGHYFGSGDVGFMRIQGQALYKQGNFEHAFSIGFPGYNNGVNQNILEYSMAPTLALRETWSEDGMTIGASTLLGHLQDPSTKKQATPFGLNAFFKKTWENTEIISELYYGENLENLNTLALGYSKELKTLREAGGFITFKHKLTKTHGLFGGLGVSGILNSDNLDSSYTYTAATGSSPASHTLNLLTTSTGYGIISNTTVRLGYDYAWSAKLNLFIESAYLSTKHKLLAQDAGLSPMAHSMVFDFGLKLDI